MYNPLPDEILCCLSIWGEVKKYISIQGNTKEKEQDL